MNAGSVSRFAGYITVTFHADDAVEDYISTTYNKATAQERNAIGFVMTVYRRRLASSFFALKRTLEPALTTTSSRSPFLPLVSFPAGAFGAPQFLCTKDCSATDSLRRPRARRAPRRAPSRSGR